jgi:ferredoxin-NADP reductase
LDRRIGMDLLTGRTTAASPPFAPEALRAMVPDITDRTDRDVYVCGPPAMTSAVLTSFRALRVPAQQVHAEKFSLA